MADIVSTPDILGAVLRIEGRRIGVHHLARRVIDAGQAPEQVAADYEFQRLGIAHRSLRG